MKPKNLLCQFHAIAGTLVISGFHAHAATGSWLGDAAGDWADSTKWTSGTIADGSDSSAILGNVITADRIITLNGDRTIGKITAADTTHNYLISGSSLLTLDVTAGVPLITTTTTGRTLTISSQIAGTDGLQKNGVGTLTLDCSSVNTFTGGLAVSGGTLNVNFANLATPTDLINSSNALILGGGTLLITGKSIDTTSQTLGDVTIITGGGKILGNKNGGTATNITLGTLTATASGGSLVVGAGGIAANVPVITTTSTVDATGIYSGRAVFFNGTANTGYDWLTNTGDAGPSYTLTGLATSSYTALDLTAGTDTVNSRITASATMTGSRTTHSLKLENLATAGTLTIGTGNTLTLTSGGVLMTGANANINISSGSITAGDGTAAADLVIHQYNPAQQIVPGITGTNLGNTPDITSTIVNNGTHAVTLVKNGSGSLLLSGANSFTGGIVVNEGNLGISNTAGLNNNAITFHANANFFFASINSSGVITLNNHSQVTFMGNGSTFATTGAVTGNGGISLDKGGLGTVSVVLNSTANTFTGPIRYTHTQQNQTANLTIASLADTDTFGSGNITFGLAGAALNSSHNFTLGSSATAPLTLNNRQFEMAGSVLAVQSINNNSAQAFNINAPLLASGTGTKTLTLGGGGTGISTFAGAITNGTITTLNLTKSGSGRWVLTGDNSYNGTTTISAGSLQIGDGTSGKISGTTSIINNANLTINRSNAFTQASDLGAGVAITGTGSFTQAGSGTTTFTAANTFTGATSVNAGTLAFSGGSMTSAITVAAGASLGFTLNLTTTSTSSVNLTAGTVKIIGTPTLANYTLMTASAITGTPVLDTPIAGYELVVETGSTLMLKSTGTVGYSSWAAANGAGVNVNDDHDADGVSNGVEYFIGGPTGNTTGFTAVPTVANDAGNLTVTWTKAASYTGTYGTDFYVETSTTLEGAWTVETTPGTVAISGNDVKYTFPTPLGSKRFARLKVAGP